MSITGDISIEAWIKLEQLPSTAGSAFAICSKYTNTSRSWRFEIGTDDKLAFYFYDTAGFSGGSCNTAFSAGDVGVWRHITVTVDVSVPTNLFYIGGSVKTTTMVGTTVTSIKDSTTALTIGAMDHDGTPTYFFDGKIKNVRLWNDIRTATEIDDNKCLPNSTFTPGTANYADGWSFENTLASDSGNNNLTAVNNPVFSEDVPSCLEVSGPAGVKTINELAIASVKTIQETAIANVKTINNSAV